MGLSLPLPKLFLPEHFSVKDGSFQNISSRSIFKIYDMLQVFFLQSNVKMGHQFFNTHMCLYNNNLNPLILKFLFCLPFFIGKIWFLVGLKQGTIGSVESILNTSLAFIFKHTKVLIKQRKFRIILTAMEKEARLKIKQTKMIDL